MSPLMLRAQTQRTVTITVTDGQGTPLSGAEVEDGARRLVGRTGSDGRLTFQCESPCRTHVEFNGFAAQDVELTKDTSISLKFPEAVEQVTVTAYRAPLGELQSPVTTRQISAAALQTSASVTMDDQLRHLPGVELFRRSSSLVANPSSQGISLRGLGSTSASRTLLTLDDVPLNDPVGGWIHWEEQPELAVHNVDVVRGGASDLYGSSAIGGVVNIGLTRPSSDLAEIRSTYGAEGTYEQSVLAQAIRGRWSALAAGSLLGTDGYIQEAPWQRGPIDTASNMHAQNGLVLGERKSGPLSLFGRFSGFNEARANGTPYQTNGTRLWRYAVGGDSQLPHANTLAVRVYGSAEHYRQTFSSISNTPTLTALGCSYRCSEIPSRFALIPDNELGAAAHWSHAAGPGLMLVAGADTHDVRVWDDEQTFGSAAALTKLHVHQRDSAGYAEALWMRNAWTLIGSARVDWFQNYDPLEFQWKGSTLSSMALPQFDQRVFDPRLGVSHKMGEHWAVSASGFRAFRAPSPSELYRSTQVGNQLTKPNPSLLSERATGWETGIASERGWGTMRASYFLTEINRPISAVTVNPNSSPILLMRENLGQIASRGFSLDFEMTPQRWLSVDGGYQYARATVTRGAHDLNNWIPEVARNMAALNVRAFRPRFGTLTLQSRLSGHQFDDDANVYLLHGYFRMDAFASHEFGRRIEMFGQAENLFDRTIEVAKTPTTTLGTPRVVRVGFTIRLNELAR